MTPLLVDYTKGNLLKEKIKDTIKQNGSIDLVVAWIHSYAKEALSIIANEVSNTVDKWELFHILGSGSNLKDVKRKVATPENCSYYQIQLGFIIENDHSRWLTHQEISNGVIEAIQKKKKIHIVGQLDHGRNVHNNYELEISIVKTEMKQQYVLSVNFKNRVLIFRNTY